MRYNHSKDLSIERIRDRDRIRNFFLSFGIEWRKKRIANVPVNAWVVGNTVSDTLEASKDSVANKLRASKSRHFHSIVYCGSLSKPITIGFLIYVIAFLGFCR